MDLSQAQVVAVNERPWLQRRYFEFFQNLDVGRDTLVWFDLPLTVHEANKAKFPEGTPGPEKAALWINQAVVVRAWASMEAFAKDVWIDALNNSDVQLLGAIVGSLKDKEVRLWQLQHFGFDLRRSLGTLLERKYTFKKVAGIVAAYEATFSKDRHPAPGFTDVDGLKLIEAKRHAIVHSCGKIDDEYVAAAGLPPEHIGKPLEIDRDTAAQDITIVLRQGAQLAGSLALWLKAVDSI